MKKSFAFFALAFLCGGLYAALPTVTGSAARQRWPFDGKVAIDFTLGRGDRCDVQLSATWDGQETPYVFQERALDGFSSCNLAPNCAYTVMWDPAKDGFTAKEYKNFKVTVTPVSATDRMFLYVDLVNGTNCWYKTRPDGIVTSTDTSSPTFLAYLKNGVLFRRVLAGPVGTYTNGVPQAVRESPIPVWDCLSSKKATTGRYNLASATITPSQQIGFSSDYFISCTWITKSQWQKLGCNGGSDSATVVTRSIQQLRGLTNTAAEVAAEVRDVKWPATGFYVKPNSDIAAVRTKLASQLPSGWIVDVPTFTQREIASTCGRGTLWWNGGDATTLTEAAVSNLINSCSTWAGHNLTSHPDDYKFDESVPGQLQPNDWGIWEPNGGCRAVQICGMDANSSDAAGYKGMDPVGNAFNARFRVQGVNGQDCTNWEAAGTIPCRSYGGDFGTGGSFRLAINTSNWPGKPL